MQYSVIIYPSSPHLAGNVLGGMKNDSYYDTSLQTHWIRYIQTCDLKKCKMPCLCNFALHPVKLCFVRDARTQQQWKMNVQLGSWLQTHVMFGVCCHVGTSLSTPSELVIAFPWESNGSLKGWYHPTKLADSDCLFCWSFKQKLHWKLGMISIIPLNLTVFLRCFFIIPSEK